MVDKLVAQLWDCFKDEYGVEISTSCDLLESQRNILEFIVKLGRKLEQSLFNKIGPGHQGRRIEKENKPYKFSGYRTRTINGLFGGIEYKRAYYVSQEGSNFFPLDERLGIEKRHTSGFNYFMTFFTGQGPYQKSMGRFHEIFRPDGKEKISLRKTLDMDYELGKRFELLKQQEIEQLYEEGKDLGEKERAVEGVMAVSIDATKVREKLGEEITSGGKRKYEIGFKDAKIAAVSQLVWDKKKRESKCINNSYVSAEEHADEFFKRIWVEMNRRSSNIYSQPIVFLGDGADWIWNRAGDLANEKSVFILDFYHACERLSEICKKLYGEQTDEYWEHYRKWKALFYKGKVEKVIEILKQLAAEKRKGSIAKELIGAAKYFGGHKDRMRYDKYRKKKLPIGSGTIESACKNVIGSRLKGGGMTWSPSGANGMLHIRCSLESGRFYEDFRKTLKRAA